MPDMKSESPIVPSDHHFALFFTQVGMFRVLTVDEVLAEIGISIWKKSSSSAGGMICSGFVPYIHKQI